MSLVEHVTMLTTDALSWSLPLPMDGTVPNPGPGKQPPGFGKFTDIMAWVKWIALGCLVIALIVAGGRLAGGERHGDGEEHGWRIGKVLIGAMIVSGAFTIIGFVVS